MSMGRRLNRLENSSARGMNHLVVVNCDGDTGAALARYEGTGRTIRPGDSATLVHTGINREPGDTVVLCVDSFNFNGEGTEQ